MYNGVLVLPTPLGVSITGFADDRTIVVEARTERGMEDMVNKTVADIFD